MPQAVDLMNERVSIYAALCRDSSEGVALLGIMGFTKAKSVHSALRRTDCAGFGLDRLFDSGSRGGWAGGRHAGQTREGLFSAVSTPI